MHGYYSPSPGSVEADFGHDNAAAAAGNWSLYNWTATPTESATMNDLHQALEAAQRRCFETVLSKPYPSDGECARARARACVCVCVCVCSTGLTPRVSEWACLCVGVDKISTLRTVNRYFCRVPKLCYASHTHCRHFRLPPENPQV